MSVSGKHAIATAAIAAILSAFLPSCRSTSNSTSSSTRPENTETHGPPPWAPAHGYRRKFTYTHYPSNNVYFDRERKLWFWIEGRGWKVGVELPSRIRIEQSEGVKITLDADNPYESGSSNRGRGTGKKK